MKLTVISLLALAASFAEIHRNPGGTTPLPHDRYIRVVSEADSPVQQTYIKTKDGLYVASAIRKPKGNGPFPAIIMFHGAPGGRGMEQIVGWSRGATGGPVWERFLQEGYVVAVSDYRAGNMNPPLAPGAPAPVTAVDDGLAIIDYVKSLPYVDPARINLYGVSLGGNLVLNLISRTPSIATAILGAPAPMGFLGIVRPPGAAAGGANPPSKPDPELSRRNIEPIRTPILILVGTADSLQATGITLHDLLTEAGKSVRMEIYENGYHDFCLGPQGQVRKDLPQGEALLDSALDALEKSVLFVKGKLH